MDNKLVHSGIHLLHLLYNMKMFEFTHNKTKTSLSIKGNHPQSKQLHQTCYLSVYFVLQCYGLLISNAVVLEKFNFNQINLG